MILAIGIMAGCTAKESAELTETHLIFTASREGETIDTKTVRLDDGSVCWGPKEEISMFYGSGANGGSKFTSNNSSLDNTVEFEGSIGLINISESKEFWAVYPYSADNSCDGSSITTVIPHQQTGVECNFSDDVFPAMAKASSMSLPFWNICGGIKFFVSRTDIKSVSVKGNNGESLAGKIKVAFVADGKPEVAEIIDGKSEVTLLAPEGGTFKAGKYYYITLLPTALDGGITMSFTTASKIGTFTSNKPQIIKRSVFGTLNNIDSRVLEWNSNVPLPEYVDLGLSVMWATCNVGAATPEEYGDYYAWGETETKTEYTWTNYKWCNGTSTSLTKYNSDSAYGIVDNKTTLDLEDDVAYVRLGGRWRMPSFQEIDELINNCTITSIQSNGVEVWQFISKKNGNRIYIPKAGICDTSNAYVGSVSYYWSSYKGFCIRQDSSGYVSRYCGVPVRPVFHLDAEYETPENPYDGIIDLGLSVNWRSCNLGATTPEEFGGYYQWAGKKDVSDTHLKLATDFICPYTSYNTNTGKWYYTKYNYTDKKRQLDDSDDAAIVILGNGWRMPTKTEWQELIQSCSWSFTCINNTWGYKVQSLVMGYSDKWIFLPATGYRVMNDIITLSDHTICYYWSSTIGVDDAYGSGYSNLSAANSYITTRLCRYYGLPIRPVICRPIAVTGISLNKTWASMDVGITRTLIASVEPDDATDKTVIWTSDNTCVATVDPSGKVTAITEGTALITVKTVDGGFTASCTVTVRDIPSGAVNLDLPSGLLWASCNIGASYCTQYGNYYAWGEIETKSSYTGENYKFYVGGSYPEYRYSKYVTSSKYGTVDNLTELQRGENPGETMDDVARAVLGGKWRMPRPEDIEELITNTDNYYTTYNGVKGWMFTSKTDSDNWIFLPAAGYRSDDGISLKGSYGFYWSSVCFDYDPGLIHFIPAGSGSGYSWDPWIGVGYNTRYVGKPVRPVIEW